MSLYSIRRRATEPFLGVSLAFIATACLTPPAAKTTNTNSGRQEATNVPLETTPKKFTHTSTELLKTIHWGWNLGNSLDVPDGETAWGNPKTTPELLKAVAATGFHLVRVPVTWAPHTGPAPDYVIDAHWLERVDEVVGYARSAGLYSVINLHHDGADGFKGVAWLTLKDAQGNTTEENNAAVRTRFVAVWKHNCQAFRRPWRGVVV